MFHVVNPFGNVHRHVRSERKKNELLKEGWALVPDAATAEKPKKGRKATAAEKE